MAKEVQMSIKMERALREQFMAVAASQHRPVDQIIRNLMRLYIADSEKPNVLTADTIRKGLQAEDVFPTACVRIPMKTAIDSYSKTATHSDSNQAIDSDMNPASF